MRAHPFVLACVAVAAVAVVDFAAVSEIGQYNPCNPRIQRCQ